MTVLTKEPIAFFSYVQNDDRHDGGRISLLRQRLEGELRIITGKPFKIFQDRNDIDWGQQWEGRINETINDVIFLIPIVTPTYFASPACRSEYTKFLLREKALGEDRLIFPVYYVSCDLIANESLRKNDEVAQSISGRQWTDWRPLRFKDANCSEVNETVFTMASSIKASMAELAGVIEAARKPERIRKRRPKGAKPEPIIADGLDDGVSTMPFNDLSGFAPIDEDMTVPSLVENDKIIDVPSALRSAIYFAYTKDFDEIIAPSSLAQAEEIVNLGEFVKPIVNNLRKSMKIRRMEILDNLSSIRDWSVTLLIDNSGSLRAHPKRC